MNLGLKRVELIVKRIRIKDPRSGGYALAAQLLDEVTLIKAV